MKKLLFLYTIISNFIYSQKVEIVSSDLNQIKSARDYCISKNKEEIYFTVQSPNEEISQIVLVKNANFKKPILLAFCNEYSYMEPFLSVDQKRLYFASNRPKNDEIKEKSDFDIWYVKRNNLNEKWSNPINLGLPINSTNDEFFPSLSKNNNLYFTANLKTGLGKDDIYFSKWNGKSYETPELLNSSINSEGFEFNAFISPDESFLIFTKYNAKLGFGSGDLYISKKDNNNKWQVAENLGEKINTKFMEYCPFYDTTDNLLYFTSKRNNLNPKKFSNFNELTQYISENENGLSKIYKIKLTF